MLTRYHERRRVVGPSREELAQLAGLSATYYTRLQQGHGAHPSESVVASLAQALCLGPDETARLRARESAPPVSAAAPAREGLPGASLIISSYTSGAAFVIGGTPTSWPPTISAGPATPGPRRQGIIQQRLYRQTPGAGGCLLALLRSLPRFTGPRNQEASPALMGAVTDRCRRRHI
ncbi:MAG TPA: helix-turn-helix transcriptional regulator [Streptosporangiaceae bacterium]